VYVDSNIFISPIIYERLAKAENSKRILAQVETGQVTAYTSTLTWDEVVWIVRRLLGKGDSVQAGEKLTMFPNLRFVSVTVEIVESAQKLLSEFELAPRDAIHVASALSKSVDAIVSDDPDLDRVEAIKRKSSASFAQER
jgi:predicted nucleic acid-binding protein